MAKNIIARDFSLENPFEEDFDIFISLSKGDFEINVNSNQEHADSLFRAFKGEYRINPEIGIGISTNLNGNSSRIKIEREVQEGMLLDGFKVDDVRVTLENDNLNISTNANRKK